MGTEQSCAAVDAYMDAMEHDLLPVDTEEHGHYLWEFYILTVDQWVRICGLLQRRRLPSSLLWRSRGWLFGQPAICVRNAWCHGCQIEYLWQDLNAVSTFVATTSTLFDDVPLDWINGPTPAVVCRATYSMARGLHCFIMKKKTNKKEKKHLFHKQNDGNF